MMYVIHVCLQANIHSNVIHCVALFRLLALDTCFLGHEANRKQLLRLIKFIYSHAFQLLSW